MNTFWTGLSEWRLSIPADELLDVFILQLPPVLLDLSCKGLLERDFTHSVESNRDIFPSREFLLIMFLNSSLDNFPSPSPSFLRKTASTYSLVRWGEDPNISTLLMNPSPLVSITLNKRFDDIDLVFIQDSISLNKELMIFARYLSKIL